MKKKFYVYALIDPRKGKKSSVFYVGKGTWIKRGSRERNQAHLREAIKGNHYNTYLQNKIKKIVKAGLVYGVDFLFSTDNEDECLAKEVFYIAFFDRNTLCNLTDGGEGTSGHVASKETRAKISEAAKIRVLSEETRAKISASTTGEKNPFFGKKHSEESKSKNSAAHKGRPSHFKGKHHPEETMEKMRKPRSKEFGEKMRVAAKNRSPETKAKMSAAARDRSPEHRAKLSAAARNMSPEHRAKLSAAAKSRKPLTEESRRKMSENRTGEKGHFYGKHHSEGTKSKLRGRIVSEETRDKLRAAANSRGPVSEETKAKRSASLKLFHANKRAAEIELIAA